MNSIQDELQQFLQKLRQQNAAGQPPTPEPVWEDIPEQESELGLDESV